MSSEAKLTDLSALFEKLRGHKPTVWDRRAQQIDWAVGQVLCIRDKVSKALDEWELRRVAAERWEALHPGEWRK